MIPKSNNLMVRDLMEDSKHGTLAEIFIIEAVRLYSEKVAASTPQADTPEGLAAQQAWKEIAEECQTKLRANYENAPITE